jgi:flavin-dependent dehydrogenase
MCWWWAWARLAPLRQRQRRRPARACSPSNGARPWAASPTALNSSRFPLGLHAATDHVVIQNIVGSRDHRSNGDQAENLLPGCVVNRDAFDRALVDFSRAAGARLQHNAVFAGLDADHSEATLSRDGRSFVVRYRALVAADGHASAVARLLGLRP